ncbi:hypothetical protein K438DRAFT_1957761 [Mycena galopus ATCC 62051]|nr:hypothetical protein K438DRAFT_1957761 [Mycena galopus ATCC 62051]
MPYPQTPPSSTRTAPIPDMPRAHRPRRNAFSDPHEPATPSSRARAHWRNLVVGTDNCQAIVS